MFQGKKEHEELGGCTFILCSCLGWDVVDVDTAKVSPFSLKLPRLIRKLVKNHWRVSRDTDLDKVYIDSRRERGWRWIDQLGTTLILQIRVNGASTSNSKVTSFSERQNRRLAKMSAALGRIDLEIRLNNSIFGVDLYHFQTVFI